jgi:TPR repeat protein
MIYSGQGNAVAQNNFGIKYEYDKEIEANKTEAINWYRKAAEQGYEDAKRNLNRLLK